MTGKDLFRGLQYLDTKYITLAESEKFSLDAFNLEEKQELRVSRKPVRRIVLLAALIALLTFLMGCGIYVLRMRNLKIGMQEVDRDRLDQGNYTVISEIVPRQVLTLSGLKGTPNYKAAQEWYDFLNSYDPDHKIFFSAKDKDYNFPAEYTFYAPYTQEMMKKIDEICDKHQLKLMGAPIKAQTNAALLDYLGIETILLPGAPAVVSSAGADYWDSGFFRTDFDVQLAPSVGVWPYQFFLGYRYSPRDCFNSELYHLEGGDWQERVFTTVSGHEVLVLRSMTSWESWAYCDVGSGTVVLRLETIDETYTDEKGYQEVIRNHMTDAQIDQVLNLVNFDLTVTLGDPALLKGQTGSTELSQTQNGYTVTVKNVFTDGERAAITVELTGPEGTDLEQYVGGNSFHTGFIHFSNQNFHPVTKVHSIGGSGALNARLDNDGKANTIEFFGVMERKAKDGVAFTKGCESNLLLSGLAVEAWNEALSQFDVLWKLDAAWNFIIPMENGDWRELEFIDQPVTQSVVTGWYPDGRDAYSNLEITSLRLRSLGGYTAFKDWTSNIDLVGVGASDPAYLQMKDGTALLLSGGTKLYFLNGEDRNYQINLEEITYLVLPNGTKLTPHWVEN